MGIEPGFVKREPQSYVGIRERLERGNLPKVVPPAMNELLAFLQKHRIRPSGAPLVRDLMVDYNTGKVEVDIGAPVEDMLPTHDRVHPAQIPGGTFATVIHRGSYDTLMETTAELLDWAKQAKVKWQVVEQHKVTRWSARVEHYLVGPPDEPNPTNWQTEIAILVALS